MNVLRRLVGVTVAVASLALSTPALASGQPVARGPVTAAITRSAHHEKTYRDAMAAIDADFARSVAMATRTLHVRMARAKSAADRIDARNRYRMAIVKATRHREVEVELLDQSPLGKNNADGSTPTTTTGSGDN